MRGCGIDVACVHCQPVSPLISFGIYTLHQWRTCKSLASWNLLWMYDRGKYGALRLDKAPVNSESGHGHRGGGAARPGKSATHLFTLASRALLAREHHRCTGNRRCSFVLTASWTVFFSRHKSIGNRLLRPAEQLQCKRAYTCTIYVQYAARKQLQGYARCKCVHGKMELKCMSQQAKPQITIGWATIIRCNELLQLRS